MRSCEICESIRETIVKVKVEKEQWLVNMMEENVFGRAIVKGFENGWRN